MKAPWLAVLAQGQAHASIHAAVGGVSDSYNHAYASFALRKQGEYSFDEGYKGTRSFTVYQEQAPSLSAVEIRYYFPDEPSYVGMAAMYRQHLTKETKLEASDKAQRPLITILGAAAKKKNVIGIPYTKKYAVTTLRQAQDIVAELLKGGVGFDVRYTAWTEQDIGGRLPNGAKLTGVLGSRKDFEALADALAEQGSGFYPEVSPWSYSRQSYPVSEKLQHGQGDQRYYRPDGRV